MDSSVFIKKIGYVIKENFNIKHNGNLISTLKISTLTDKFNNGMTNDF